MGRGRRAWRAFRKGHRLRRCSRTSTCTTSSTYGLTGGGFGTRAVTWSSWGFEYRQDAERFWADLRERLAKFSLELNADKTRLIRFGRFAAQQRKERGLGKPETFQFLGFTHICGRTKAGRFKLTRITDKKRMRTKLSKVKAELIRRRHLPIPDQGRWLASVLRGHCNYYAVPDNSKAIDAFRFRIIGHWLAALRRRSQRTRLTWKRMYRLAERWLPRVHILHPWPNDRFDARTRGRSPVR